MEHFPVEELEAMIDANGLTAVMEALAHICREKADHLRSNWQDHQSARVWDYDAKMIEKAAGKLAN